MIQMDEISSGGRRGSPRGHGKRTAVEEEIWRLKQRNRALEQELEFLKKVSRYFAKDPK